MATWSTWLGHLQLLQGDAGGRESVLQGEQWEVPLKNACKYYFCHMPLLFCCMILFLTVLWLHQYWLCHHHVICCLYATYHLMFKHVLLSLPPASPCNSCRCTSQVDQAEEQDGSGFLSFSCSNKLKTNEGCVIDLNSKINRIFWSSCMNKSKDL
jgi:hypothetical protein